MSSLTAVTGATGFVGSELCRKLEMSDIPLRKFCRSAGQNGAGRLYALDLLAPESAWHGQLRGVHTLVHLAALTHEAMVGAASEELHAVNVEGTRTLVEAAVKAGVKRVIFLSSIKVNGEETKSGESFKSHHRPAPTTKYGRSKLLAENIVIELCDAGGVDWTIIRAPLVCGVDAKGNLDQLLEWAQRGLPMPFGSIHNARSMISVSDLADLLFACATHPEEIKKIFLAADDRAISTTQLCRWIIDALNSRSVLIPVPEVLLRLLLTVAGRGGVVSKLTGSLEVDNSETKACLNWKPAEGIEASVRTMVLHYAKKVGAE